MAWWIASVALVNRWWLAQIPLVLLVVLVGLPSLSCLCFNQVLLGAFSDP